MSLLDPQCKHEAEGRVLAGIRTRLAQESHIAELMGDVTEYKRLRDRVLSYDDKLSANLFEHRTECER